MPSLSPTGRWPRYSHRSTGKFPYNQFMDKQIPAIKTSGLTKRFKDLVAVDDLSIEIAQGAFIGFLGPNGAGKSTTIAMLTGLLRPTQGDAQVLGRSVISDPIGVKSQIGVVAEQASLYEHLSGREYLWFVGRIFGLDDTTIKDRSGQLFNLLDLEKKADNLIRDYSHGMQKKVALAAALIHDPRILFLDEPFEGVDVISAGAIRELLTTLAGQGVTIFFSTHILEIVEKLCSEVAIIDKGRLLARGTIDELRSGAASGSTFEEVFLRLIGAETKESLSWITSTP